MRLKTRGQDMIITPSLKAYAERRVHFALARFSMWIQQVAITVIDVNGPRRGVDKRCRMVLTMRPRGTVVVVDEDSDLRAAIARAAERSARTVARKLDLRRDTRKHRVVRATDRHAEAMDSELPAKQEKETDDAQTARP